MRTRTDFHAPSGRSTTLLVLLPPSLSSIEDLQHHGLVAAVRQRRLPVDVLLADVTAQHVLDGTAVAQLHNRVLLPAQAQGYHQVWLAGISLGAFCALQLAAEHADQLAGLCLLAPYPGTGDVLAEIRKAGGAAAWHQCQPANTADERRWWHWLCQESQQARWSTPVYLGTGHDDRFLRGQRLLADLLPPQRTRTLAGHHHWPTWKALWEDWLDHGPLRDPDLQTGATPTIHRQKTPSEEASKCAIHPL